MIIHAALFLVGILLGYFISIILGNRKEHKSTSWVSGIINNKKASIIDLQDPLDIDLGDL